jgi:hypothetical protein
MLEFILSLCNSYNLLSFAWSAILYRAIVLTNTPLCERKQELIRVPTVSPIDAGTKIIGPNTKHLR